MMKSEEKVMKKIVKTQTRIMDDNKKKRRAKSNESFKNYIHRVLKQIHPGIGISKEAMSIINNFCYDIFERFANEASKLATYSKRRTMSSKEIEAAVRLLLTGELAKHAVYAGRKAVFNYTGAVLQE